MILKSVDFCDAQITTWRFSSDLQRGFYRLFLQFTGSVSDTSIARGMYFWQTSKQNTLRFHFWQTLRSDLRVSEPHATHPALTSLIWMKSFQRKKTCRKMQTPKLIRKVKVKKVKCLELKSYWGLLGNEALFSRKAFKHYSDDAGRRTVFINHYTDRATSEEL